MTPGELLLEGQRAISSKDYESALLYYNKGLEKEPKSSRFHLERGLAYELLHQPDKAIEDFTFVLENGARDSSFLAYSCRARCFLAQGNNEKAIIDCDRAISINGSPALSRAMVYDTRGIALDEIGDHVKAIADFTEGIVLSPQLAKLYHDRGLSYMQLGQQEKAIEDFTEFLKRSPAPSGYASRALAYQLSGQTSKALADSRQAQLQGLADPLAPLAEEWKQLAGPWRVIRVEASVEAPKPKVDSLRIESQRMIFSYLGTELSKFRININPTAKPKAIDWIAEEDGTVLPCIYSLDNDILELTFPLRARNEPVSVRRPKVFDANQPVGKIVAVRD